MDYWDAVQRYEKARNQLSSERVDMIMGMYGDRSKRFYSAGLDRDDEVDPCTRVVETQELSGIKAQHIFS
jgi:hypothetical protein